MDAAGYNGGVRPFVYRSYGIERLWWEFKTEVRIGCCCGWTYPGGGAIDTCAVDRLLDGDDGWFPPADDRLHDDGTATYYALWHAIRYSLAHNDKASQPIIILLTDGADEHSVRRFRSLNPSTYWTPIPSMLQAGNFPSDTSFTTMRSQFLKFMDSIQANTGGVKLHVVVMDTAQKPDYATLYHAAVTKTGGTFSVSRGSELDSIYNAIGAHIRTKVARPVLTSPMFVDELSQNLHYVPGTLIPLPSNTVSCSAIVIDSSSGRTRFNFYVTPMDADQVFAYRYTFRAYLNPPADTVTRFVLNADPAYSQARYLSSTNAEEVKYFPCDTIYVLSKITGLFISSVSGDLDTSGTTRRTLQYTITAAAADTGQSFYGFMGLLGSADTLYKGVSAQWNFNPLNWIQFGSRSITNQTASSVTPYAKLGPSMADFTEQYLLSAVYPHPQHGTPMGDAVAYVGMPPNQKDFVDSVVISTSGSALGIRNPVTIRGDIDYLAVYPGQVLYALAHWRVSNGWTVVSADWSAPSGFTRYNLIPSQMTGTDSVKTLQLKPNPDPGNTANQSDSGTIRISYTNVFNDLKQYTLNVEVLDTTVQNTPNAVAIFTEDKYQAFKNVPAKLESLYYYFDTLSSVTVPANDTDAAFYGLIFCVKGGVATFMGVDSGADWNVNSSIAGKSLTRTGYELSYSNTFAPRTDLVTLNSSIDSTAVLTVVWSYGTGRFLSLETGPGSVNDNLAALPEKSQMLFDPNIGVDSVYGVVRDQFDNYIPYGGMFCGTFRIRDIRRTFRLRTRGIRAWCRRCRCRR
jgi:hypothetical protein